VHAFSDSLTHSFRQRELINRYIIVHFTTLTTQSRHLPAALLASFVKRLARLSLTAPPAAIIMIIPFIYNVLKRHPALMVMIHRIDDEAELGRHLVAPAAYSDNIDISIFRSV
jgi:hypothetical protein